MPYAIFHLVFAQCSDLEPFQGACAQKLRHRLPGACSKRHQVCNRLFGAVAGAAHELSL